MEGFLDFYHLHATTDKLNEKYTKNSANKICRFCGKSYPIVSFETKPHIVPELFGRNNITSNFECDDCNKKFQQYENDVSTMIQHYLTLLNIKSKKGVPTFQSKKTQNEVSTVVKSENNERIFNFGANLSDFKFNEEGKTIDINFRTRKFCPFSVYKIFLKMGISLLTEEELLINQHYLEFLNSEHPINNGMQMWKIWRYKLQTKYFVNPKINLYKAKETLANVDAYPEYAMTINFSNIIFQFFLPISRKNHLEHSNEHKLKLELFPAFMLEDVHRIKAIEIYNFDLNETNKVSISDKITMHYKERVPID